MRSGLCSMRRAEQTECAWHATGRLGPPVEVPDRRYQVFWNIFNINRINVLLNCFLKKLGDVTQWMSG
jgi:hypothetical protein